MMTCHYLLLHILNLARGGAERNRGFIRGECLLQLEEERRRGEGPSEEQRLCTAVADAVRSKAAAARLEATDEAKRMNQMVLYSKCMAIRCARPSLVLACILTGTSAAVLLSFATMK